ncbi:hypothetical protein IFM89_024926 [Coptis chinensis]|uniref:Uncharacterized protein n=1 Tax=Coptis chinensis TaxID=261450 RepID=A0A835HB83_9MAGN|nr:hypothetical protein IFM89_024926 [Coptis chinensis]
MRKDFYQKKKKRLLRSLSFVCSTSWTRAKAKNGLKLKKSLPMDSIMSWYLCLEGGKFCFPAQGGGMVLLVTWRHATRLGISAVVIKVPWLTVETNNLGRKDHQEVDSEAEGFYGGIRKLHKKEEISAWKHLWPKDILQ